MKGEEEEEGKEMTWGEKKKVLTQRKRRSVDRRGERERERGAMLRGRMYVDT